MNGQVAAMFTVILYIMIFAVIGRALISWFPVSPSNPAVQLLVRVTEPLLAPARRIVPSFGMIDLSAMAVILLLYLMIYVVGRAANA